MASVGTVTLMARRSSHTEPMPVHVEFSRCCIPLPPNSERKEGQNSGKGKAVQKLLQVCCRSRFTARGAEVSEI